MAVWDRTSALLRMTCPLGPDQLIPRTLTVEELISTPFSIEVSVISQLGIVNPDDLLHHPACVMVQADGVPIRYFHGIVQSMVAEGDVGGGRGTPQHAYRLKLVPRLWFLAQTTDCRVYQEKTVVDILQNLFTDAGITGSAFPSDAGEKRGYTVQFNESDLAFAHRLMEEAGFFYFFEHSESGHKLIIGNGNEVFINLGATMHISGQRDGTMLGSWSHVAGTTRGKMTLKDYDPEKPDSQLEHEEPTQSKTAGASQRDQFRWPARSFAAATIKDRPKWEMQAAEAASSLYESSSRFGRLFAGARITVVSRPTSHYDGEYAIRGVSHHAIDNSFAGGGGNPSYSNHFTCFPTNVPWRQPMVSPRPRVEGIHTALVLGQQHGTDAQIKSQDGEEIYTDSLGRVKVRFYWDHRAEATGGQSVWARVIQPWAGKGWGAQFIPRVGTEVAVAFVDGDPDRPIIIGGLYNGRDTPIYNESEKTKSGFRSRSTLKGGSANFNEFTFDDKKGNELVFLHAEKNLTTEVENDQTLKVDNCRIVTVAKNETVEIGQDRSVTIDKGNDKLDIKMGNLSIKADMGKIEVEAMQSITLTVGSNFVKIDQSGVTINGTMIKVAGTAMTDIKAPMTKVSGDAMLTLKGGIMMLN